MTDETSGDDFSDLNERLSEFSTHDGPSDGPDGGPDDGSGEPDQETIDAIEEAQRAMAEARARVADVPAEVVVTNHVMGLYELGAIHLSADPPDLVQASLAIDAVGCLVEGLGERLGEEAGAMRDALNNIRLAFVQIKGVTTADDD